MLFLSFRICPDENIAEPAPPIDAQHIDGEKEGDLARQKKPEHHGFLLLKTESQDLGKGVFSGDLANTIQA